MYRNIYLKPNVTLHCICIYIFRVFVSEISRSIWFLLDIFNSLLLLSLSLVLSSKLPIGILLEKFIHCLDRTPDCTFWTRIVASKMADRKSGER